MSGPTKYTFWIKDKTPETMGLGRLVEYYQQLAALFGDPNAVHLIQVRKSSHGSELRVEAPDAKKRLWGLRDESAPTDALRARDRIDAMLADDCTSGHFADQEDNIVYLFSAKKVEEIAPVSIRDSGAISGELYYMNGGAKGVSVRIRMAGGRTVNATVSKELAKKMRPHLLEQVRVFGEATWSRDENGWLPSDFDIQRFTPLVKGSLRDAINQLREMDVEWRDDPLGFLADLNGENGKAG